MGFQTITRESEIQKRLEEMEKKKQKINQEIIKLRNELRFEINKNRHRKPSRFL